MFVLMIAAPIILSSCATRSGGGNVQERILEIRTDMLHAQRLIINAQITADYGDRVYEFTVRYTGEAGISEIAILSPEQIAGVTAEITDGGTTLIFDGARLDTGAITGDGLSPIGAIPLLISEWRGGRAELVGAERFGDIDTLTLETAIDDFVRQRTWFDARTLLPVRAEISNEGRTIITSVFSNIVIG